jgi:DNA-binding NarL/FixJ family response regulator
MVNICIVDDNPFFLETQERILRHAFPSAGIRKFATGETLLSELGVFTPDMIFMDISLPGMDGLKLTRVIKEINKAITVVVITSYDDVDFARAAADAGADGFLSKNKTSTAEIVQLTRSMIEKARS